MQQSPLLEEIKNRGFNKYPDIIVPSEDLISIRKLIDQTYNSKIIPSKRKLKYVLTSSREFLDSHFQIQNVPFYKETIIGPIRIEKYGTIHPYGLPIIQIKGEESFYGSLREVISRNNDEISNYSYRGIELSRTLTDLSALSYTHEITHSELNHIKGLIINYSNTEFLSIFLETLHAYETSDKILRIHDNERLHELSSIISDLEKYHNQKEQFTEDILVEGSSYAESTLKAYKLFIRYYYNPKLRKEILLDIQRIFNHEISVEEFLDKYEIHYENSQNVNELSSYLLRR